MEKKRRSEDSAESNTPAKRVKAPEFNGTAFKAMLKDPSTAMKGMVMVVRLAVFHQHIGYACGISGFAQMFL